MRLLQHLQACKAHLEPTCSNKLQDVNNGWVKYFLCLFDGHTGYLSGVHGVKTPKKVSDLKAKMLDLWDIILAKTEDTTIRSLAECQKSAYEMACKAEAARGHDRKALKMKKAIQVQQIQTQLGAIPAGAVAQGCNSVSFPALACGLQGGGRAEHSTNLGSGPAAAKYVTASYSQATTGATASTPVGITAKNVSPPKPGSGELYRNALQEVKNLEKEDHNAERSQWEHFFERRREDARKERQERQEQDYQQRLEWQQQMMENTNLLKAILAEMKRNHGDDGREHNVSNDG